MELHFDISDEGLRRRLSKLASPELMQGLHEALGTAVLERLKDHLSQMSVSRHKTAGRLGATHTGFYEHAAGRTIMRKADTKEAVVAVENTPGLSRAYHDLHITPKRGSWLTIPLHRSAYGNRVADLRNMGHKVFRPGVARILAETTAQREEYTDKDGKKRRRAKLRPLYALVKSVRVPRDKGLLPQNPELNRWVLEAAEDYISGAEAFAGD